MKAVYRCELSESGCSCEKDDYTCGGECHYNKNDGVYNVFFFHNEIDEVKKARCPKSKLLTKFLAEPSSNGKFSIGVDFIAEAKDE